MPKILRLKPSVNKTNKQVTLSLPKGKLPAKLKNILKDNPEKIKTLNFQINGWSLLDG